MSLLNTIAGWFNNEVVQTFVPRRSIFRGWVQRLAAGLDAELTWDSDGDAVLSVSLRNDTRGVVVALKDGRVHVVVPSHIKFQSGGLPGDVAAFLSDRNRKLDFADWDAIDNGQRAYFTIKTSGLMDRIDFGSLKDAVIRMLAEAIALDQTLMEQGYCR